MGIFICDCLNSCQDIEDIKKNEEIKEISSIYSSGNIINQQNNNNNMSSSSLKFDKNKNPMKNNEAFNNENREEKNGINEGLYGFNNPGNDCFMISSLQLLSHINEFSNLIEKNNNKNMREIQLSSKYYETIIKEIKKGEKIIYVNEIKEEMAKLNKRYETNNQQDANEFISLFLNEILLETQGTADLNNPDNQLKGLEKKAFDKLWKRFYLKKGRSYMVDLFYGILKTETKKIDNDELISVKFHMYNMLELPLYFLDKKCSDINLNDILKNYVKKKIMMIAKLMIELLFIKYQNIYLYFLIERMIKNI